VSSIRAIVVGGEGSEGWRAARTARSIAPLDGAASGAAWVWLVVAGAWRAGDGPVEAPPPSATGRAVIGVGLVRAPAAGDGREELAPTPEWARALDESGGLLEAATLSSLPVASALVPAAWLPAIEEAARPARLDGAEALGRALSTVAAARRARVVRLPALDVAIDPRPRALLVVTTLQIGGAERVVAGLAHGLPRRGIAPVVAVLGRVGRPPLDDAPPAVDLAEARARGALGEALADLSRRGGCDLVHAHLLAGRDLEATRAAGVPVVVTAHNARAGWPAGLDGIGADGARLVVACALAVEDELRAANIGAPVRTAWNAIDVGRLPVIDGEARRRARVALGIPSEALVAVTTANGRTQKRLDRLPAVIAALAARGRDARLLVVGDLDGSGVDARAARAAFDEALAVAGVGARVRALGLRHDVAQALAAADVYVSTSAYEGMSLAMLEALAVGLPVVATAVGGAPELARAGAGLTLVERDAPPSVIAEVIGAATVDGPPLAPAAVAAWRRRFDRDVAARRHAALYRRAIAPRASTTPHGIILVINNFSTGGAQSSARRLLVGARERGVPVLAITLQEEPSNPTPGRRALEAAGVPVLAAPPPEVAPAREAIAPILDAIDARPEARVLFWNALAEHKLRIADALLDRPPVDVSPGEMLFAALDRFVARFAGEPEVPLRDGRDYGRRLAAVVVKYAGEAERARALGAPVHVIPNGVALPGAPVARVPDGRLAIGTAARLSPQKRLEELIAAFRLALPRLPPSTVLRLAGDAERGSDDYAARLRREAAGLPVEWVGELDPARFHPTIDVFAMISAPAGCPNASLEAMAAGLPVVATDVGGAREQVEGGAGLLVPDGDVAALADALVATAHDAALRRALGSRARARVAERFSVKRMIDDYLTLLGAPCTP
jgi:glycosyltransferase involved in cell wall biosynthesis